MSSIRCQAIVSGRLLGVLSASVLVLMQGILPGASLADPVLIEEKAGETTQVKHQNEKLSVASGSSPSSASASPSPNLPEPSPDPLELGLTPGKIGAAAEKGKAQPNDKQTRVQMPPLAPARKTPAGSDATRIERPAAAAAGKPAPAAPSPGIPPLAPGARASSGAPSGAPKPGGSPPPAAPIPALKPGIPLLAPTPATTSSTAKNPGAPAVAPKAGSANSTPGSAAFPPKPGAPVGSASTLTKPANSSVSPGAPQTDNDPYPTIGKLEQVTFGGARATQSIDERLANLENAIFAKTFPSDSLFDRSERLKRTLLGPGYTEGGGITDSGIDLTMPPGGMENPVTGANGDAAEFQYLDDLAQKEECQAEAPRHELEAFALELINYERQRRSLPVLDSDAHAQKLATEHVIDLGKRGVVSHTDARGRNPDHRFTILGGTEAVNENLNVLSTADLPSSKLTKSVVAKLLKQMLTRQDDREAILAPEATHAGFSLEVSKDRTRIIGCTEIVTKHGAMQDIPQKAHVGDRIEVSGTIGEPYLFDRITVAWEGLPETTATSEEVDEPLPYFPPLDYIAYKEKSEKDYSKAIFALKTVGMLAAIAGGMFVPPVALAAPLIIMAGPNPSDAKPQSEVPTRGGVKLHGGNFSAKIPINNASKEGLYYITVWASLGEGSKSFPVSRRTILVKSSDSSASEQEETTANPSGGSSPSSDQTSSASDQTSSARDQSGSAKPPDPISGNQQSLGKGGGSGTATSQTTQKTAELQQSARGDSGAASGQNHLENADAAAQSKEFKGDRAHAEKLELPASKKGK